MPKNKDFKRENLPKIRCYKDISVGEIAIRLGGYDVKFG